METNKMKKIILALAILAAVVCPVFAGESWIGVTTGPAFEMSNSDDYKDQIGESFVTDFNWDVNVEGAYYFNEAETMGIGAKLGFGFNFGTTFDNDLPVKMDNPAAGTRIAPAVTFQYRLGLTDALDLRMGAGLQYVYTIQFAMVRKVCPVILIFICTTLKLLQMQTLLTALEASRYSEALISVSL